MHRPNTWSSFVRKTSSWRPPRRKLRRTNVECNTDDRARLNWGDSLRFKLAGMTSPNLSNIWTTNQRPCRSVSGTRNRPVPRSNGFPNDTGQTRWTRYLWVIRTTRRHSKRRLHLAWRLFRAPGIPPSAPFSICIHLSTTWFQSSRKIASLGPFCRRPNCPSRAFKNGRRSTAWTSGNRGVWISARVRDRFPAIQNSFRRPEVKLRALRGPVTTARPLISLKTR